MTATITIDGNTIIEKKNRVIQSPVNTATVFFVYKKIENNSRITSLKEYSLELERAGHSQELISDIIEGLADSPLYEGQTS